MYEWIRFLRRHRPCAYWRLTVLRDQWELGYEVTSPLARRTLFIYGAPHYQIGTPQYPSLRVPLTDPQIWAVLSRLEESPQRFPRFLFGHEFFQVYRASIDPRYVDVRYRAVCEYLIAEAESRWSPTGEFIDQAREVIAGGHFLNQTALDYYPQWIQDGYGGVSRSPSV